MLIANWQSLIGSPKKWVYCTEMSLHIINSLIAGILMMYDIKWTNTYTEYSFKSQRFKLKSSLKISVLHTL